MTGIRSQCTDCILHRQLREGACARCWELATIGRLMSALAAAVVLWLTVFSPASAADVAMPHIPPFFAIEVSADRVAEERRGNYDVYALEGKCRLQQGELTATADEIIVWCERHTWTDKPEEQIPGKVIVYLNGSAEVTWGQGNRLADQRWMGRLFSLHPIRIPADIPRIRRHDIPQLDWSQDPQAPSAVATDPVQLAQYAQPLMGTQGSAAMAPAVGGVAVGGGSTSEGVTAPPLLMGPVPVYGAGSPNQTTTTSNASVAPTVPPLAGAVPWSTAQDNTSQYSGNTSSNSLLPSSGLVIPSDGSVPFPAAGIANPPAAATPALPAPAFPAAAFPSAAPQVVRQPALPGPLMAKSFQFLPRSGNSRQNISWTPDPARGEMVGQITGGFKLVVNGVKVAQADGSVIDVGTVSLEADNAVVWQRGGEGNFLGQSTPDRPLELYLDGNIVFAQGNRVIYANRMYYNVSSEYGMVLDAEVLTPVPQYQGLLRLRADVLRQDDRRNFTAYGAALTSSRLGVPRYWLQADEVKLTDNREESDLSVYAPSEATRATNMRAEARNNFVYLGGVPVFYWPTFGTSLQEPSFYLSSIKLKNDQIFGFQAYTNWNIYQALGIRGPEGTNLTGSLDYLSERGPAAGVRFDYNRPTWFFGAPGTGFTDAWFIYDQGLDVLGFDRINLTPEEEVRGRILGRQRLYLSPNIELMAESGYISDRNFLEQYFEQEWDTEKDFASGLRLRHYKGNQLFDLSANGRINEFFTETESLPRLDHYVLGQDLFGERFTYNAYTSVGYLHQRPASTPLNPAEVAKFSLRPWESDSEGLVATTRQELSLPMSWGVWDVVPFLSGEAGFWNEDINQQDQTRLLGQAGLRTSLPMWRVYPNVENRLFDLRGLAHKVTLESELFYADSNLNLDRLPLYDPLDDNSQEHFRRRFIFNTFGGTLPERFDERNYAFRNGLQRWVTAGSRSIADDLTQARFGINQRWQTKRGLPGRERIVDLVSLDTDFIVFPQAERDNFGEELGAINYDFRYHIGDRLTLLSDGYFDVFSQGLKALSAGAQISRPGRGDAYIGMLSLEGPISANILNGYGNYRLNEKWIVSGGAAFDFGSTGSIGQNIALTRIGETALVRVGLNIDSGRDNVSFNFNIEPRFLPTVRLGSLGGELIPPVGLFGLE